MVKTNHHFLLSTNLKISYPKKCRAVLTVSPNLNSEIKGYRVLNMILQNKAFGEIEFTILDNLCAGIFLGQIFMGKRSSVAFSFGSH